MGIVVFIVRLATRDIEQDEPDPTLWLASQYMINRCPQENGFLASDTYSYSDIGFSKDQKRTLIQSIWIQFQIIPVDQVTPT